MLRRTLPLCLLATACNVTTFVPNEDYCGINGGDAYCREQAPQTPYCVLSSKACFEGESLSVHDLGCVAEQPDQTCRQACGIGNGDACLDPTASSSSSTTEDETESSTTQDPTTDTDESSSSTGAECMNNDECTDAAAPYCLEGTCVPCSGALDGDIACMEIDPVTPLCVDDVCVQCSTEDASACEGTTPVCGPANACVGCEFHEQCEALDSPACDFTDGSCFDPSTAEEVDLSIPGALAAAVGNVEGGEHVALLITGSLSNQSATIDAGKVIAIVSANNDAQNIQGAGANSILTVNGPGSTAILHRVVLQGSSARGIDVNTSGTLYADAVRIADNNSGGINLGAATTARLRNCMIAGDGGNAPAIASSGTLSIVYSTLGRDTNFGDPVLECTGGAATVRNSIIVSETNAPGTEVDCPGVAQMNTTVEATMEPETWFPQFASGDYSLSTAGGTEFEGDAVWEDGDPPFDFDGNNRPSTDGSPDFAGADVP